MSRSRKLISVLVIAHAISAFAGDPEDLVFKNSFERCDNFTVPPGAVEWDGGGDGESWSDPLNWQGDVIPADNDSVAIADDGGITVIYDVSLGTTVINVMDICESLSITGGALEVSGSGFVRTDLELTGSGDLIVEGDLSVAGSFDQSSNSIVDGTGVITVGGKYTWSQGTIQGSGETILNGGIDITTNTSHSLRERTLTINGISSWTGGTIFTYTGPTIDNNSSFDIQTDADFSFQGGDGCLFINDGTITKSSSGDGDGITKIVTHFENNDTISVASGELQMGRNDSANTSAGTFTVASGSIFGVSGNHDFTAASFTGAGGFRMVGGSGTSTIGGGGGTYTLTGPLIANGGEASFDIGITVSDDTTLTNGNLVFNVASDINANLVLSGSGDLVANAALGITGTFSQASNSIVDGTGVITVGGKYTWSQGTIQGSGETILNGGIDITTNTSHSLRERTLTINGISSWTGGTIFTYTGPTIDNNSSFDIQTDADFSFQGGDGCLFINDGTITKSSSGDGDGITKIVTHFENNDTISVASGELQMGRNDSANTSAGTFTVASGSIFGVSGNHDFTAASFTGAGGFRMVGGSGTSTIGGGGGTYTLTGPLIANGGEASFDIGITVSDDTTLTNGNLVFNVASDINANLVLSGSGDLVANAALGITGTFSQASNSIVDGTGVITVGGKYTWSQGTIQGSGETILNGGIDITTNTSHSLRERTLTINGISSWTGGTIFTYTGPTIDNNSSFDIQTDADFSFQGGDGCLFINDGTITKSSSGDGDGITKIVTHFENNDTISVASGELQMGRNDSANTSAGTFTVASGSIFGVSGNHDFTAASFTGAGGFRMVGGSGTSTIGGGGGTYTLTGPLIANGGEASFDIGITVSDDTTLTNGNLVFNVASDINANLVLSGSGDLVANAALGITGTFSQASNSIVDGTGVITVGGKYTWSQGTIQGSGETILNGGIDITTNTSHSLRERTLTINGISSWTGGTIFTYTGPTIDNNSSFDIQTDADFSFQGGAYTTFSNDGTMTKSVGNDLTSIVAEFTNSGSLSVASGEIGFTRTFTQTSSGTLFVDITSDSVFDVFAITQGATLDGTLDINRAGGYTPTDISPAFNFEILTASSVTGIFSTINNQSIGNGFEFVDVYPGGGTSVELDVVAE